MRRYRSLTIQVAAFAFVITVPLLAHAATTNFFGPIVTNNVCHCQSINSAPNYGCVLQVIQTALNAAVSFSVVIITIYIAWAGVGFMINPTSPEARQKGVARITNAVIGLMIVLCAWLLVDTVMKVVYNPGATGTNVSQLGPWNAILNDTNTADQCLTIVQSGTLPALLGGSNTSGGSSGTAVSDGPASGDCSATALTADWGDPNIGKTFACIIPFESKCDNSANAGANGLGTTAGGRYQIVLGLNDTAHNLNITSCTAAAQAAGYQITGNLNCSQYFRGGAAIDPNSMNAKACVAAQSNPTCNTDAAKLLFNQDRSKGLTGYEPWEGDSAASGQRACVQQYANGT